MVVNVKLIPNDQDFPAKIMMNLNNLKDKENVTIQSGKFVIIGCTSQIGVNNRYVFCSKETFLNIIPSESVK